MFTKKVLGKIVSLLYIPFSIYGSWLLYNHVHATDLLWFLWWVTTPLLIFLAILGKLIED